MPESCQFREKPGSPPVCKVMPAANSDMCPRHEFLQKQRDMDSLEKERQALLNRTHKGKHPKSRRELIEQGYQYIGNDTCACGKAIEWWRTPNQKKAPYDPMPHELSVSNSHFTQCRRAFEKFLRRSA